MFISYILVTVLVLIAALFAYDRDRFWERLAGNPDLGMVDFASLARGPKPNEALACPPGHCPNYKDAMPAPVFNIEAPRIARVLADDLAMLERTTRVDDESDPLRFRYVTRTPLMHYPDTVNIEIIPLASVDGEPRSSIAIHSRAKLGYSDLGMNRARIEKWLSRLEAFKAA